MQATLNETFRFAGGRDYMMRSEKRGGSGPSHRAPAPGGKKPHRRRRRAGFFYKLFMMILLLTIWPVGLLMLWQRKVRWGIPTKLLASVVTLAVCILLLGSALTVDTNIPEYTAAQNKINGYLDIAADAVINASEVVAEKAVFVYEQAGDFADALWEGGKVQLSYAIDEGVLLAQDVKETVSSLVNQISATDAPEATPEAVASAEATSSPTAEPTAAPTPSPTAEPTPEPTPEPLVFTVKSAGDAVVYYNDGGKCYHMTSSCASMKSAVEHTLGETRDVNNHRCSICGTPEKSILDEEYIVWLDGEGTAHLSDECASFEGSWKLITAETAIEDGAVACVACEADRYLAALATEQEITVERAVKADPTEEPTEAPVEEPTEAPTEDPTEEPTEEPVEAASEETEEAALPQAESTKAPAEEPTEASVEEPSEEPTVEPSEAPTEESTEAPAEEPTVKPTVEPTVEPTEEPTEAPTEEPTTAPTPQLIVPTMALKDSAQAKVYCAEGDEYYHVAENCTALENGEESTLGECAQDRKPCQACAAPDVDLIDQPCLWQDEDGLCHVSDDCTAFAGGYALVLRDDALADALEGCTACGAAEYLIENTAIDYAAIPTPEPTVTPEPTATPNPNAFIYTDILVVDVA